MRLSGHVAIVTAGASGIGAATARRFAAEGADVVIADIDDANAAAVVAEINAAGAGKAVSLHCDVGSLEDLRAAIALAVERFGKLSIVHNNAAGGGVRGGHLTTFEEAAFDNTFAINVRAGLQLVRESLPHLRAVSGASILWTSSLGGKQGTENLGIYGASKAAIVNLVKTMGIELAADGIRVNAVCPGVVATPGLVRAAPPKELLAMAIPMGRAAEPEEIASVFAFLASADAAYITGQSIDVDGGMGIGARAPKMPPGMMPPPGAPGAPS
jgi:NAD(P)-dependent dehydrogenase (short-subunit alcohol dehydrogenase family)